MKVRVDLYSEGLLIGSADLDKLDPPMGCATGAFAPTKDYDPVKHAIYRNGEEAELGSLSPISALLPDGPEIEAIDVTIVDARPYVDELEANVIGMEAEIYRDLFSSHPHYITYYQS